jgi:hypothetical protein
VYFLYPRACYMSHSSRLSIFYDPISVLPVTARPKAWVCDRSLAGIEGSNPAGGMDVCLFVSVCVLYR